MELNRLAFHPRSRSAYEVFDLTLLFTRAHLGKLMLLYVCMVAPVFLLSHIVFDWAYVLFFVWWLKPVYERPLLDYLSRVAFNQSATISSSLAVLKRLAWGELLLYLTIYRLSPNRAFLAPVDQLEQLTGARKSKRKQVLSAAVNSKQTTWMLFCVHLELILALGISMVVLALVPDSLAEIDEFTNLSTGNEYYLLAYNVFYLISITLVAPFFVCGSFLGYLHRRIDLEAWDIELAFKNIKARMQSAAPAIFAVIFCSLLMVAEPVLANETTPVEASTETKPAANFQSEIKQQVEALYQAEGVIEKQTQWIPKFEQSKSESNSDFWKALASLFSAFGVGLGYVFWGIVAFLAIWLVYWLVQKRGFFNALPKFEKQTKQEPVIPTLFAQIETNQLPPDLLQAAEAAYAQGNLRLALGYLLHYSLLLGQNRFAVKVHKSMTEGECKRAMLIGFPSAAHDTLSQLFACWIQVAWAHQTPAAQFDALLTGVAGLSELEVRHES
jgi:hypothetical protein